MTDNIHLTMTAANLEQGGVNQVVSGIQHVMALSGKTLPQVTAGGYIYGILHVVVSDGWGPYTAHLDTTGLGIFTHAINMTILNQVPGIDGVLQPGMRRSARRMLEKFGLMKRTFNINQDFVSPRSSMLCIY